MNKRFCLLFAAGALPVFAQTAPDTTPTSPSAAAGPVAPAPAEVQSPDQPKADKAVVLDPFLIDATRDKGYNSENTLSGSRLNTPSKYVGAADTEVTQPLMMDLGLFSEQDLLNFTPNTSSYQGAGFNSTTDTGPLFGFNYSVRGMTVTSISRDFVNYREPDDAYNIDRFSFTRGPNSILFGVGQPGGIINSVSKTAIFDNTYSALWRGDTNGSRRATFDLNQVIIPNKLAIRLDGLDEDAMTNRKPSDRISDRLYGTLTARPTTTTTVKVSVESGRLDWLNVLPWVADNGIAGWLAAGKQAIPSQFQNGGAVYAQYNTTPAGSPSTAANTAALNAAGFEDQITTAPQVLLVNNSALGGSQPIMNMGGFVFTARPTQYNGDRIESFLNPPIPYTTNVMGQGNRLLQHFTNEKYDLEQRVGSDLFIDFLYFRERSNNFNDYTSGSDDTIYQDENPTLLTWNGSIISNPNFGRYFLFSSNVAGYLSSYLDQTKRLTASYEFDFRKYFPGLLGDILGHHNFAGLREEDSTDYVQSYADLANTSPGAVTVPRMPASALTTPLSSNNRSDMITYITPGQPITYSQPDMYGPYGFPHMIFAGTPLPPVNADGVTPAFVVSTSTRSLQKINSQMIVAQDYWWKDRIVTTFGVRRDVSDLRLLTSLANSQAYTYDASKRDIYDPSSGELERAGETYTQGIVVTPIKWIGLYYNRSDNFVPPAGTAVNIYGQALPNGSGKGQDYGIKLHLLDDRIEVNLDRFSTYYYNVPTGTYRNLLDTPMSVIQSEMQMVAPTNPMWTGNFPWPAGNLSWQSLNNTVSSGEEITINTAITNNWRLTANVSTQNASSTAFGGLETQWLAQAYAYFNANPQYASLLTGSGPQNSNETIYQRLQDISNYMTLLQSLNGTTVTQQPRYTANLVTAYDFTWGWLKGIGVGASDQWRQRSIIGYAFQPGTTSYYNTARPYYSDPTNYVGVFGYYVFKVFGIQTRVQLNINDIGNDDRLHPYRDVDSGNGNPVIERYSIGPGRSFALQVSITY